MNSVIPAGVTPAMIPEFTAAIRRTLRNYQDDIHQTMIAAYKHARPTLQNEGFDSLPKRCKLIVLPTGTGKTFCFTSTIAALFATKDARRVLFLAHKEELCSQIVDSTTAFGIPRRKIDIVIQSTPRNRAVTVGTVQSFTAGDGWRLDAITPPDVIVIDECHRSAAATYQQLIEHYPRAFVFGFTATPVRVEPEFKKIFVNTWEIVYNEYTLKRAIEEGILCNLRYYRINLRKLGIPKEEQGKYNCGLVNDAIVKKYFEIGGGKFIVFGNSVGHSKALQRAFHDAGVTSYHVDGFTKKADRRRILAEFREFSMNDNVVICNYGVYTEGVDIPDLRGVSIACKLSSKSIVKFLQMVGRATRNFESGDLMKEFGIVLEVRNNRSKALTDALDKVFRLYYAEPDDDFDPEPEPEEREEEEIVDVDNELPVGDGVVGIDDAELELQAFFSTLPATFIRSNLDWKSTTDGIFFLHVAKDRFFEVIRRPAGFIVHGVNTRERKELARLRSERDVDEFCRQICKKFYGKTSFMWAANARAKWDDQPATEKQRKILKKNGYDENMTKRQASRILDMITEKQRHEPISKKQQNFLYAIGFRGDFRLVNKANVRSIISQFKDNIR